MIKVSKLLAASALALGISTTPASALNIILRPDSGFTTQPNGAAALYAFQKAANYWNTVLTDNVTLHFDVHYAALGPNIIGSTGSNGLTTSVAGVYAGLASKNVTNLDHVAVANLRTLTGAGGLGYRMPDSVTGPAGAGNGNGLETATRGSVFDNDNSWNNIYMSPNTANAKVLGLNFNYLTDTYFGTDADADITFSSAFNFDFDPTDGIGVGQQDFISVAIHEMGHALGFVSGADVYDYYASPNGPGRNGAFGIGSNWDSPGFDVLSVWDFYRAATNGGLGVGFNPADGKRYIQLDPNRAVAFSLDGVNFYNGNGSLALMSTGRYNGDGQQASHWKDGTGFFDINNCFVSAPPQIGIMDPTSGSCQMGIVTSNDLAAFDAMGYTVTLQDLYNNRNYNFTTAQVYNLQGLASVPEPASWAMMIFGFGLAGAALRRRAYNLKVTYA